jgi:hypothetical protein
MHRMPAGFPSGIPGSGFLMERAIQHAPHFLQFIFLSGISGTIDRQFGKNEAVLREI